MKWKHAAAGVAVAAIISAPIVSAAPGNGNGKKPGNPGNTISQTAKSGGGVVAIKSALAAAKPENKGRKQALERVTANHASKTKTPAPTTQTTAPAPTTQTTAPAPTTQTTAPAPTTETTAPAPTTETTAPAPTTETTAPAPTTETTAPAPTETATPAE